MTLADLVVIMRAGRVEARTTRSSVSIRSTSHDRPAKKKVSPGESCDAKASSTLPRLRPFLKRTVSIVASTMMPALRRCWRTNCGWLTRQTPPSSTSRLKRSYAFNE